MDKQKIFKVGGAVRDQLLGLEPKDVDYVVIDTEPEELLALGFSQVGADFPVFLHPTTGEEFALARLERKTGAGYLGFATETRGVTIEDDLSRRDLTINSMALDHAGNLIDPFNGQADLKDGILRHTSSAFSEDPLRVVRLARFIARFNFSVAPETFELCKQVVRSGALDELPNERFWKELNRILEENHVAEAFNFLIDVGAVEHVTFLRLLLGAEDKELFIQRLRGIGMVASEASEDAVTAFVFGDGLSRVGATLGATSAAISIADKVEMVKAMSPFNADSLLDTCKWSVLSVDQSRNANDILNVVFMLEMFGEVEEGSFGNLQEFWELARTVKAADVAPGQTGPAVGKAILEARRDLAIEVLSHDHASEDDDA